MLLVFPNCAFGKPNLDLGPTSIRKTQASVELCRRDVVHIKYSSLSSDPPASPLRCDGGWSTRPFVMVCSRDRAISALLGYTARSVFFLLNCCKGKPAAIRRFVTVLSMMREQVMMAG